MYSQLAYHVSIAHIDELNRHAAHRNRPDGDQPRRRPIRRFAERRSSRPGFGQRQPRQLLDPRV